MRGEERKERRYERKDEEKRRMDGGDKTNKRGEHSAQWNNIN